MTRLKQRLIRFVFFGLCVAPAAAYGQANEARGYVAPFIGATFAGGDAAKSGAPGVGIAAGWLGAGWLGLEADVAHSETFFEQDGFRTARRITTAMGNVIVKKSSSAISLYGTGGMGLMKPKLVEAGGLASLDVTQPAFNIGAGVICMTNGVGIRGDVRYVRAIGDDADDVNPFGVTVSTLHFVRASIGLVVGF